MKKISTGADSTIENWIELCTIAFGEESTAVTFLRNKAKDSPNGLKEEILTDEGQLIMALAHMNEHGKEE